MDFDQDDRALLRAVSGYLTTAQEFVHAELRAKRTPLGDVISAHLGVDAVTLPIVQESIAEHRLVDADIALEMLSAESGGRLIGITGGEQRQHQGMTEYVGNGHLPYGPGPVDYVERASGPGTTRRVVALGMRLLHFDGQPLAVTQRGAAPQFGRRTASLEVMGADSDVVSAFLAAVRARMVSHSVLRGRVLSFVPTEYGQDAGATFVPRPSVAAEEVVLPDGLLDGVVQHVIGIGEHRELLRASGQHLKRGVLLHGPPGTGKTLTVRHLLTRAQEMTVVLLSGPSIRFVSAAAEVARTFQPSIVVLEDIDLVAMERNASPQPLLFEVLEALDGLDGDVDVAFVMTTNRVEVLERALAERPGRVDLAVEVPRPARAERERLYRHYARGLGFGDEALRAATEATEGVTGSFAKELVRRSVLRAAERGEGPVDADLSAALAELLDARQELTRRMLGDDAGTGDAPQGFPVHGAY